MYIPMTGLLIITMWAVESLTVRWPAGKPWLIGAAIVTGMVMLPVTRRQIDTWRDDIHLFSHGIEVTRGNYIALNNLGQTLARMNRQDEATVYFEAARRMKPDFAMSWYNLGTGALTKGRLDEAKSYFEESLRLDPSDGRARNNLGVILGRRGQWIKPCRNWKKQCV